MRVCKLINGRKGLRAGRFNYRAAPCHTCAAEATGSRDAKRKIGTSKERRAPAELLIVLRVGLVFGGGGCGAKRLSANDFGRSGGLSLGADRQAAGECKNAAAARRDSSGRSGQLHGAGCVSLARHYLVILNRSGCPLGDLVSAAAAAAAAEFDAASRAKRAPRELDG